MRLWLDDVRTAPDGWTWAKTVDAAKQHLQTGTVEECSLDHDLGACETCLGGRTFEQWLLDNQMQSTPHCSHVGTGYDLVLWMAETNTWPTLPPMVHSANPVGGARMRGVISRYFPQGDAEAAV